MVYLYSTIKMMHGPINISSVSFTHRPIRTKGPITEPEQGYTANTEIQSTNRNTYRKEVIKMTTQKITAEKAL